jgi:hypothetical protein
MAERQAKKPTRKEVEARAGLRLSADILESLRVTRIHCNADLSIVHQHLARRYVIRGEECGGAVPALGAYCGYVDERGQPLSWLQPVDTVGVNGRHAVVIAPSLVRLHMVRVEHTYDLLITRHWLELAPNRTRPTLESSVLLRGRQGTLALDLWDKDSVSRGRVRPLFYSYSGEPLQPPDAFEQAILDITVSVCCIGCKHSHLLQPPLLPALPITTTGETE